MSWNPDSDKAAERQRYDARAKVALDSGDPTELRLGSEAFDAPSREPFLCYEDFVRSTIRPEHEVLELGAGTGMHTRVLVETGAKVMATDISPSSLEVIRRRFRGRGYFPRFAQDDNGGAQGDNVAQGVRLRTEVADIEALPFPDASFDVVTCAGSLTYGDPATVDAEVQRVLRPGGALILVDVLDHNPIYKINRWVHYLRGHRTRATLSRMPTLARIEAICRHFAETDVRFFGGLTWAMPVMKLLLGETRAARLSREWDRLVGTRRSAFKFVLLARGKR